MEKKERNGSFEYDSIPIGIYIIGKQRSGETWLARLLVEHDEIYAVKKETDEGKKPQESYYFSHFIHTVKPNRIRVAYSRYCAAFFNSKYFLHSGVGKSYFEEYPVYNRYLFFHEFMKHATKVNGKRLYLEKTQDNTPFIGKINAMIENIKFIYIKRDVIDLVNSTLNRYDLLQRYETWNGKLRLRSLVALYETAVFDRIALAFAFKHPNLLVMDYEKIIENRETSMRTVMKFIRIPYQSGLGDHLLEPVPTKEKRGSRFFLGNKEEKLYRTLYGLIQVIPLVLVKAGCFLYWKLLKQRYRKLPDSF